MICYHVHGTFESSFAKERWAFYDTVDVIIPSVVFDGSDVVYEEDRTKYDSVFTAYIEVARTVTPYFNLYINSASASQTVGSIDLRIVTADTLPEDEIVAFVVITEDSLSGVFEPFCHVCRFGLQFPVTLTYPDTLDTTITFSHNIPPEKLKTVIFIQDMDTKEVMQSIISDFEEE